VKGEFHMSTIQVFKVALTSPRADTIICTRDTGASHFIYSIETDDFRWPVSLDDAARLSRAAGRIAWRLDRAEREDRQPEAFVAFRQRVLITDGSKEKIELAISVDDEGADVVFEIDNTRFHMRPAEAAAGLIRVLHQLLGEDVALVRRASEPPPEPYGVGWGDRYPLGGWWTR
jgi:hypothetical protein